MSSLSTESQSGLRHVNGVPVWDGDIVTLRDYETTALWFRAGLKPGEQEGAVARLWANLQGPTKEVVRMCKPQDFEDARRVGRLLRILRDSPLASMPVPDAFNKIQAYDQIRRRPGEVIGDYIVREQHRGPPTCPKLPRRQNWSTTPRSPSHLLKFLSTRMLLRNGRRRRHFDRSTVATRTNQSDSLRAGNSGIPAGWNEKRHGVHSDLDTAA